MAAWDKLVASLEKCVVRVSTGVSEGSGFVIRQGLVLTCRHVVEGIDEGAVVRLTDHTGRELTASVLRAEPPLGPPGTEVDRWPDLALLAVSQEGHDLPAVLMDDGVVPVHSAVAVAGYPSSGAMVGFQTRAFTAGFTGSRDRNGHLYLGLTDESVDPGMSGGPVLTEAGFVCGYVRVTRLEGSSLGGFVVPLAEVLPHVAELQEAFHYPGPTVGEWLPVLTGRHLKDFHRDETGRRFTRSETGRPVIDIELVRQGEPPGPVAAWEVTAQTEPVETVRVTTADLGEGVLEAVDHWSRRHAITSREQVNIIGRVLFRALLPQAVAARVESARDRGAPPLVRLLVNQENSLAAIPWKFAIPDAGLSVSTSEDMTFVRLVDRDSVSSGPSKSARVLIVVNGRFGARRADAETLAARLESVLRKIPVKLTSERPETELSDHDVEGLYAEVLPMVDYESFETRANEEWDVIHFVGSVPTAETTSLAFAGYGDDEEQVRLTPVDISLVMESLRKAGARAVVIQSQDERAQQPLDARQFLTLLSDEVPSLDALVIAEHAVTPEHVITFVSGFYAALAAGKSAEDSVQAGRRRLFSSPPNLGPATLLDRAAFGSISVTTTRPGDVRILEAPAPAIGQAPAVRGHTAFDRTSRPRASRPAPVPPSTFGFER